MGTTEGVTDDDLVIIEAHRTFLPDPADTTGRADPADRSVRVSLPADPSAVAKARSSVAARWGHLDRDTLDDVEIIVAELVSNAVRHGRPEIELLLRAQPFAVDVGVLDHNPRTLPGRVQLPDQAAHSGRGLFMVDRLALRWGVDALEDGSGKTVWASVATE